MQIKNTILFAAAAAAAAAPAADKPSISLPFTLPTSWPTPTPGHYRRAEDNYTPTPVAIQERHYTPAVQERHYTPAPVAVQERHHTPEPYVVDLEKPHHTRPQWTPTGTWATVFKPKHTPGHHHWTPQARNFHHHTPTGSWTHPTGTWTHPTGTWSPPTGTPTGKPWSWWL